MKRLIAAIAAAIGIAMGALADPLDLAKLEYSTRMGDGIILTGELKKNVQISIADGATVTLRDITIHGANDGKYKKWAGITCEGDATLVLEGGNAVIGFHEDYPGIYVPPGKTLTIKGTGTLAAGPGGGGWRWAAGIGGGNGLPCGNIVIESGIIYAQAFLCAAGIGASTGACGDITINGGTVIAKGGKGLSLEDEHVYDGGAGIGGGDIGSCGNITINGGNVSADAGFNAAGIGASSKKGCGNITISGGTVSALGSGTGAGIGSAHGSTGNITISGGTVWATGGETATGIGAGASGTCSGITITEGITRVAATSGSDCENPIGAGVNGNCSSVSVASGLPSVTSGRTRILGKVVDLGLLGGEEATIPDGVTLTGTLGGDCKISIAAGATVTLDKVQIQGASDWRWAGLTCLGNATLNLSGTSVVKGFHEYCPGIYVPNGSTLTIQGDGVLSASSNGGAAGIGGGKDSRYANCGNIVIKSGTVQAVGGDGAAGIGGGGSASGGKCGSITIKSGVTRVSATGGAGAPNAIGAGKNGTGGAVNLDYDVVRQDSTDAATGNKKAVFSVGAIKNLGSITADTTFKNGDILTGTLGGNYKISIADGATVTLSGTTINGAGVNDSACNWAGITCEGDATIILEGVNVVRGFYYNNSGIFVPAGKTLTIRGSGSLEAYGGMEHRISHAAGIGAHRAVSCGNIVIEGGNITAIGKTGIGCGNDSSVGNISILGGSVFAEGEDTGIGGAFNSARIGDIFIGKDIECVIAKSAGLEHDIIGVINARTACGTITVAEGLSDTTDADGQTRTIRNSDLSKLTGDAVFGDGETLKGTLAGRYKVSIADGATVTLQDVTINGKTSTYSIWKWAGLTCEGDATIILAGDNTVKGFDYGYPGIFVPAGKTLTIKGTGSLAASSNDGAAGIGGGIDACGNIVIEGGSIEATGSNAAGIGGGDSCGDITILGGIVKAKGSHAAGIGSDSSGECGTITISSNGGIAPVVEAVGGSTASGIGGADGGYCGNIRIESGYVVATGGKFGSGIGGCMKNGCTIEITGGTVVATGGKNAPGIGHDGIWSPCGTITIGSGIDQVTATAGEGASPIAGWDALYHAETEPVLAPGLELSTEGATCTIVPASTSATALTIGGGKSSMSRAYSCEAKTGESFSVACDGSWSATANATWIKLALADNRVSYALEANDGAQRIGMITVTSGSFTCVCTITQDKPLLIGGKESMARTYDAAKQTDCLFSVTCSQSPWTAASSASWVTLKSGSASGTGAGKVAYDVAANTSPSSRTATITVASRGLSRICTITQKGNNIPATTLTIGGGKSSMARNYSCEAKTGESFSVACDGSWSATANATWIKLAVSGNKVTYSLEANEGAQRIGKITVKAGSLTCVCTITQDKPLLIGGKESMARTYDAAKQTDCFFSVACSQSPWTAVSSASWVTLKSGSASGTGAGKVAYDVAANTSPSSRTATITVASRGLSRICTITQKGNNIPATTLTIGGGKSSMARNYSCEAKTGESFSVACDGSWSATANATWIKLAVSGNKVTYSLEANEGAQRIGKITVKAGSLTCVCTITQDKPLLIGGKESMSRTYDAAKHAGCYFSVACSQSPWTAASSASWVTLKTSSGTGTGTLTYDVAANSGSQRTATITVTSRGLSRVCTITQRGASSSSGPVARRLKTVSVKPLAVDASVPAGLYEGVLADGEGTFSLLLDEPEGTSPRTAYLYLATEGGTLAAECEVVSFETTEIVVATEDGELFRLTMQ